MHFVLSNCICVNAAANAGVLQFSHNSCRKIKGKKHYCH